MKQTFVKAALATCCMAAVACKQAPMTMGPGQYAVITVATSDREIPTTYSATIRGRQDIAIYPQVSGTISELCVNEGQEGVEGADPLPSSTRFPTRLRSARLKPTSRPPRPASPLHS